MDKEWNDIINESVKNKPEKIIIGEVREAVAEEFLEVMEAGHTIDLFSHRGYLLEALENNANFSKEETAQMKTYLEEVWKHSPIQPKGE